MRSLLAISAFVCLTLAQRTPTDGLDILLVGDYGWTPNMTDPNLNFDAINAYVGNWTTIKNGKIDMFMTTGDNIYIRDEPHPKDEDADKMMSLFLTRPYLKDLNIWAIRGNHDCYALDAYFQVNLTKRYPTWKMPDLWYNRTFDIGNGKKLLMLFVDTCLAICANQTYA